MPRARTPCDAPRASDDIVAAHSARRLLEPFEKNRNLGGCDGETTIGGAVINPHLAVHIEPAAREHDLVDIAEALIFGLRLEHPFVGPGDHSGRVLEIEECKTE